MFDRTGVHGDQRRMDDRTGIHQRARERIAAWLDGVWKRSLDHAQRVRGEAQRKHAGRQPRAPARDPNGIRPLLARQPRQRPGLRGCDLRAVARVAGGTGEDVGAEGAGRQKHDLAIAQMRRGQFGDCGLREGRRRTQDEIGRFDGFRDRRRDHGQPDITSPRPIDDRYRAALRTMRLDVSRISTPQPDFVTGQGEVAGGRERTIALHPTLQSSRCPPLFCESESRYAGFALTFFSCHAAQVGRSIWNRSVERAYQPLPCMRAIRRSACVSM